MPACHSELGALTQAAAHCARAAGEYDLERTAAIRQPRVSKPSPCFRAPSHSKAAQRQSASKLLRSLPTEPFGGQWLQRDTIDRSWTAKRNVARYY
jgi:hypothetical protein